jgi:hypothetical protein
MQTKLPRLRWISILIPALATALISQTRSAHAYTYNHTTAQQYADSYALSYNNTYPQFSDDCTNFASQALLAGGLPMNGAAAYGGEYYTETQWFMRQALGGFAYTSSWTVAQQLKDYLVNSLDGTGYTPMPGTSSNLHSGVNPGDVLFYDWDVPSESDGQFIDHTTVQTTSGVDINGTSGDRVDEHTSNRKQVHWTLQYWNALASTTYIYPVHIN